MNSPILRQRCPDLRNKPEFHHIAASDGYTPYFDPFFTTFLSPLPERERRYSSPTISGNAATLASTLKREIYWEKGYAALAALHEQSGQYAEALRTLEEGIKFHPSLHLLRQALSLAKKSECVNLAEEYAGYLEQAASAFRDKEFFAVRYETIVETARMLGDEPLAHMAAQWHKEHGHLLP